jgi:uncharacterized protein YaaW (UPF0174 family)
MADEKKSKKPASKSKSKSKDKSKKGSRKSKKSSNGLKRPQTPYFLFCSKAREEHKKKGNETKLNAKQLGDMWKKLSKSKKRNFKMNMKKRKKNMKN